MARESYAQTQLPETGKTDVPYPDYHKIVQGLGAHQAEVFYGTVTCEDPIAALDVELPFDPAHVIVLRMTEAAAPVQLEHFAGMTAAHGFLSIADGTNSLITSDSITLGTKTFEIGANSSIQVADAVLLYIAFGGRDVNGSL